MANPKIIVVVSSSVGFVIGVFLFYLLDAKFFRSSASHVFLVVGGLLGLALGLWLGNVLGDLFEEGEPW